MTQAATTKLAPGDILFGKHDRVGTSEALKVGTFRESTFQF